MFSNQPWESWHIPVKTLKPQIVHFNWVNSMLCQFYLNLNNAVEKMKWAKYASPFKKV